MGRYFLLTSTLIKKTFFGFKFLFAYLFYNKPHSGKQLFPLETNFIYLIYLYYDTPAELLVLSDEEKSFSAG